jgi:hypothetical protein
MRHNATTLRPSYWPQSTQPVEFDATLLRADPQNRMQLDTVRCNTVLWLWMLNIEKHHPPES